MMKFLILDDMKQVKRDDIFYFAKKNNIVLDNFEVDNLMILLKDKKILDYSDEQYELILKKNII